MTVKLIIQKELVTTHLDNEYEDDNICYCDIDELDDLYKYIDSDDVMNWCAVGNLKFLQQFNKVFRGIEHNETDI